MAQKCRPPTHPPALSMCYANLLTKSFAWLCHQKEKVEEEEKAEKELEEVEEEY